MKHDVLSSSELAQGLSADHRERLLSIATRRDLGAGEYLFRLGDEAEFAGVLLEGRLEFCFPIAFGPEMRDVAVESKEPGSAVGWSAVVSPHRFTLSARAAEPSVVAIFPREQLMLGIEGDAPFGLALMSRVAGIVGTRLLKIRALWARELQRSVTGGLAGHAAGERAAAHSRPEP